MIFILSLIPLWSDGFENNNPIIVNNAEVENANIVNQNQENLENFVKEDKEQGQEGDSQNKISKFSLFYKI